MTVTDLFIMPAVTSLVDKVIMKTVVGGVGWEFMTNKMYKFISRDMFKNMFAHQISSNKE